MNHQSIPQRKQSAQMKTEQQKQLLFNNTNVMTGISAQCMQASYRTKQLGDQIEQQQQQYQQIVVEPNKNKKSSNQTHIEKPFTPNTKILNSNQMMMNCNNNYSNTNGGATSLFNSTAPIKFQNNPNKHTYQENQQQPQQLHHQHLHHNHQQQQQQQQYENGSAQQIQITQFYEQVKINTDIGTTLTQGTQRNNSQGSSAKNSNNYSRQTNFNSTPKNNTKFQYSNAIATQLMKQGSNNNLRNKYNRNQNQQVVVNNNQSQGRSNTASKSSSSKNLLNKTQQQIPSHLLNQTTTTTTANTTSNTCTNSNQKQQITTTTAYAQQRKDPHKNNNREKTPSVNTNPQQPINSSSSRNSQKQNTVITNNNNNYKSNNDTTNNAQQVLVSSPQSSNNNSNNNAQLINAHKNTLNEYKQFMEKQKQMLKQLQANKIALMLNAFSSNPAATTTAQVEDQNVIMNNANNLTNTTSTNKKQSLPISKVSSPKNQSSTPTQHHLTFNSNTVHKAQKQNINEKELQKDNCNELHQNNNNITSSNTPTPHLQPTSTNIGLSTTPRTNPIFENKVNHQQEEKQRKQFEGLTPREQQQKVVEKDNLENQKQDQQNQQQNNNNNNQDQNLNEDSMCFSKKSSLEEYIIGKQIGQGAYAVVRLGLHKPSNKKVAMKIYKKYKLVDPNRRKSVKREIKLMEKMKHQNIIRLYEVIDTSKYVILVMEYVGGGSLHGYLKSKVNRRLDEQDAKRIFRQVLEGIKYCHSRCITHRDIKLENLLLDDQNNIKIIDFGFSTCIPNDKKIKIFCGTPSYMAPEIVQKLEYAGPPADIWALGVLLFTILSGCFPYRGATDKELYKKIMRADYKLPSEVLNSLSSDAINLLKKIFQVDANKRPTAKELLNDPWLQDQTVLNKQQPQSQQLQQQQQVRSNSLQTNQQTTTNVQQQQLQQQQQQLHNYRKSHTDTELEKEQNAEQQQQQQQKQLFHQNKQQQQDINSNTQQAAYNAYFGNSNYMSNPNHHNNNNMNHYNANINQQHPYQDSTTQFQLNSSLGGISSQGSARNTFITNSTNYLSNQNIDQATPLPCWNRQQQQQQLGQQQQGQYDENIIQTIVSKLGYSVEEVKKYVLEENSFVSVLYHKLLEEAQQNSNNNRDSIQQRVTIGSLSAKSNVQPSFIPSIANSLNQSNLSGTNIFNNTQQNPFSVHLDRSRGDQSNNLNNGGHHHYYGSFQNDSQLSQTMGNTSLLSASVLSGIARKDQQNHQRNRDPSLNGTMNIQQHYDILSSEEENIVNNNNNKNNNNNQLLCGTQNGSAQNFALNSSTGNISNMINNSTVCSGGVQISLFQLPIFYNGANININGGVPDIEPYNSGGLIGGNNTQPINFQHMKKNSLGGGVNEIQNIMIQGGGRRQGLLNQQQQPTNLINKNLQLRREFL